MSRLLAIVVVVLLAACGDDAMPTRDAGPACDAFAVTLEVRGPDGHYAAAPTDAEIVLGFQGFRYIYVRARTDRMPPVARGSVVAEPDGVPPVSQPIGITFHGDAEGGFVSDPVMVFFNDVPLPQLVGVGCRVWIRAGDMRCGGETEGRVTLRYDPGCYEGPTGERICTDGGLPSIDAGSAP